MTMTTYQTTNAVAGSTQEVMKVQYTAKTHTSGGRRGGVSRSVPMLSQPKAVADLIEQAAAKAGS
jgi:hypothetical protein